MSPSLTSRIVGEVAVAECSGRIVAGHDSEVIYCTVREFLEQNLSVVLNLSDVTFIDSSGLGMLVRLVGTTRNKKMRVLFCGMKPAIRKIFDLTALATFFEIRDTEEEALAALSDRLPPVPASSGIQGGILCVHDSVDVLAYLRESLSRAGCSAQTANTVPDAVIMMKACRPKLLIGNKRFVTQLDSRAQDMRISVLEMPEDFSTSEASEALRSLLAQVRLRLQEGD